MKTLLKLVPLLLLLFACERGEPVRKGREKARLSEIGHEMLVLGEQMKDPYSVENITLAVKSIYPDKASRMDIKPTDIYVRFLPSDDTQYLALEALGLNLLDHPLDRKIIREGDYYHDPDLPSDCITWQYAVVPNGFVFPAGIQYEILDECYIADNDVATRASGIDWDEVEREAYRLTGNESMLKSLTRADGEGFIPEGRISIVDDDFDLGEPVGVSGVMVCVNSFVKFATAYTDEEGYYEMKKAFSTDVRYRLVFKNRKGFSLGVNLLLVPASISTLGQHSAEGLDVIVDKEAEGKLFSRCVVNNACYDYYARCKTEGASAVATPPENLRIWLFQNVRGSVAPMLQQGVLIDSGLVKEYLGEYADLLKMFLPDMAIGLKEKADYASIYSETIHMLAHASHFMRAGRDYWEKYMLYLLRTFVANMGFNYGSGLEAYAGYCEVSEMWSYFLQNIICKERYGIGIPTEGLTHWFSPQILLYLEERGLSESKIFSVLGPDVTSLEKFKSALTNVYPEHLSLITQAFERYEK